MCTSEPKDRSAEIAAQQEAKRQAAIRDGTTAIDNTFSQFNDDFYGNRTKAHSEYYLPELDRQYKQATDRLVNSLGGNMSGSEGAKALGELTRQYEQQKASIINSGLNYGNEARLNTANQRAQLISQLEGGGSVQNAGALATNYAKALGSQNNFSPLGNLFGSATAQGANAMLAPANGYAPVDTGFFNSRGSKSTSEVS
jgi:hypothetical protein